MEDDFTQAEKLGYKGKPSRIMPSLAPAYRAVIVLVLVAVIGSVLELRATGIAAETRHRANRGKPFLIQSLQARVAGQCV